jgi:erythronate-4-phosphate dehydrogenase
MQIVADQNIPCVQEIFSTLGEVRCVSGRSMNRQMLQGADILLVRSVTRVGPELLEDTAVRFVGTATIGTDHVDQKYLGRRGIAFANAAGSNANSVVEYVLTALLVLAEQGQEELAGKSIGIIGVGNIGSKVEKYAQALGMKVLLNDPPRQRQTGDPRYLSLDEALQADIITLHVPLNRSGPDATYHLIDEEKLSRMKPGAILINTSRGPVVDNAALKAVLQSLVLGSVVLDVWEDEPDIDVELLDEVTIATPHIAGYSLDGKVNGAIMLYRALCKYLKVPDTFKSKLLPAPPVPFMELSTEKVSERGLLYQAFKGIYDIRRDDRELRAIRAQSIETRGQFFDQLRKNYPVRREASNTLIKLNPPRPELARKLITMGFQIE